MTLYHLRKLNDYDPDTIREILKKSVSRAHDDSKIYVRVQYVCDEIMGNPEEYPMFVGISEKDIKSLISSYAKEQKWKKVVKKQTRAVFMRSPCECKNHVGASIS